MNNTQQVIKDEIYKYVSQIELTQEELSHIDTYVNEMLNFLEPLIVAQENVSNKKESFDEIKKMILKSLGV